MQSREAFLGEQLNDMLSDLERLFKVPPFHLHYVSAREAYNIVKAGEAGMQGNPNNFRDFAIPQPANRKIFCNKPYKLEKYSKDHVSVKIKGLPNDTVIMFKDLPLKSIEGGKIRRAELAYSVDSIKKLFVDGNGKCKVCYKENSDEKSRDILKTWAMPSTQNFD
jgi:hypothetical protein